MDSIALIDSPIPKVAYTLLKSVIIPKLPLLMQSLSNPMADANLTPASTVGLNRGEPK